MRTDRICAELLLFHTFMILINNVIGQNNAPICTPAFASVDVVEDTTTPSLVYTLTCSDTDAGTDGTLSCAFQSGNDEFAFSVTENGGNCEIRLTGFIDYDFGTRLYTLVIRTSDGGSPSLFVDTTVDIAVTQANDQDPELFNEPYSVDISEDAARGSTVFITIPLDLDLDVDYNPQPTEVVILTGTDSDKFFVDESTGVIYLKENLDFETTQTITLSLEVRDLDIAPQRTAGGTLVVNVVDVNDNSPACTSQHFIETIPESTAVNAVIFDPGCTDAESGTTLTYNIVSGDPSSKFSFVNGELTLAVLIDADTDPTLYSLTMTVTDTGTPALSSTFSAEVFVTGINDNLPSWDLPEAGVYTVSFPEDSIAGTTIATIQASDADVGGDDTVKMVYSITSITTLFDIDADTGEVYLIKADLDRETQTSHVITVSAHSTESTAESIAGSVTVTVTDTNDQTPTFGQSLYTATLQEDAPSNTVFLTVAATDLDEGTNSQLVYSIASGSSPTGCPFSIVGASGALTHTASLDFEAASTCQLSIEARDSGTTPNIGTAAVVVTITGINEFDPTFSLTFTENIPEDTNIGDSVAQVTASDSDAGVDGTLVYSITNHLDTFLIEPDTGIVRLKKELDRETVAQYEVEVLAIDSSQVTQKTGTATLTADITDVNEHAPQCTILSTAVLTPPVSVGDVVNTHDCTDADDGINGQIVYSITSGDIDSEFAIQNDGRVLVDKALTKNNYFLTIEAADSAVSPLSTTIILSIQVQEDPQYTNLPVSLDVSESTAAGTVIETLTANVVSGAGSFSLQTATTHFQIDSQTGELFVYTALDREVTASFSVTVRITDVTFSRSTDGTFVINILDSNDNVPAFPSTYYSLSLPEDTATGTGVLDLSATDNDIGQNADLVYSISGGNADNKFSIDANGMLLLDNSLDAETTSLYTLTVLATDNGVGVQHKGTAYVAVEVGDVEEFSPAFLGVAPYTTSVGEDAALITLVYSMQAEDQDRDSQITYSILSGNDGTFFIDGAKGDIYLVGSLNKEAVPSYSLVIEANSAGILATATLDVTVTDANDNAPQCSPDVYSFTVSEDQVLGATVGQISCTDSDEGANSVITYSLVSGNDNHSFRMNGDTIEVNNTLNSASNNNYLLVFEAKDQGVPPLSSAAMVTVSVSPNYKDPRFGSVAEVRTVSEDLVVGSMVFNAEATLDGATEGALGDLDYSIVAGITDNKFTLDTITGELYLTGKLDRETIDSYDITILATNRHDTTLRDTVTLTVDVTDVNDVIPTFSSSAYPFSVDEGLPINTIVDNVIATDTDLGTNSVIQYAFISGEGMSDFDIDSASGSIKTAAILNAATRDRYALTVMATDNGTPSSSSTADIVITVNDVNDQSPTFDQTIVNIYVTETEVTDTSVIYYVLAEDGDTGSNGVVRYSILSGNDDLKFSLDPNTGELRATGIVDRETKDSYALVIVAEDSGTPPNTGTFTLNMNITDINDHDPALTNTIYYISVARTASAGTSFLVISGTDQDIGANGQIDYFIVGGDTENHFVIGITSGEITTVNELITASDAFSLEVHAIDKGYPRRTSVATVEVTIDPPLSPVVNDFVFSISESASVNDLIGVVTPDIVHLPGAVLDYFILSGDNSNNIDIGLNNGLVEVATPLDREVTSVYYLTVQIQDGALSYNKRVTINVDDVNDITPDFGSSSLNFEVVENLDIGFSIGQVTATDTDSGANGVVNYYIDPTNALANDLFNVDGALGTLTLKQSPDYEMVTRVTFTLFGSDGGSPSRTGSILVVADIRDVYDESIPSPQSPYYSVECPVTANNNDVILTLTAADFGLTIGPTDTFRFISRSDGGIFGIDESSGNLYVSNKNYLYEDARYFLWVGVRIQTSDISINGSFAVVRIDTVVPTRHMVVLRHSVSQSVLESQKNALAAALQAVFPGYTRVGIWRITGITTTSRRRLLADESESRIYVVNDPTADTVDGMEASKSLMSQDAILSVLRESSDGTPASVLTSTDFASFPVISVSPDTETVTEETESWPSTTAGIAVISTVAITIALVAAFLITYFVCTRDRKYSFEKEKTKEKARAPMSSVFEDKKMREPFPLDPVFHRKQPAVPPYSETIKEDNKTASKSVNKGKQSNEDAIKHQRKQHMQTTIKNRAEMSTPDEVPGKFFHDNRRAFIQKEGSDVASSRSDGAVTPKNILIESVETIN